MNNSERLFQALKPDFNANLKEVNNLIDADMGHQKYVAQLGKCELCQNKAVDELDFETGNNADYSVTLELCEDHLKECDATAGDFDEKYAAQILDAFESKYE
jgi:hypothetical protein